MIDGSGNSGVKACTLPGVADVSTLVEVIDAVGVSSSNVGLVGIGKLKRGVGVSSSYPGLVGKGIDSGVVVTKSNSGIVATGTSIGVVVFVSIPGVVGMENKSVVGGGVSSSQGTVVSVGMGTKVGGC